MEDFQDELDIPSDYIAGVEDMRVIFFEELRRLIQEKDKANDTIATEVLGWAYEQLGNLF
jgi:hypothetical protein